MGLFDRNIDYAILRNQVILDKDIAKTYRVAKQQLSQSMDFRNSIIISQEMNHKIGVILHTLETLSQSQKTITINYEEYLVLLDLSEKITNYIVNQELLLSHIFYVIEKIDKYYEKNFEFHNIMTKKYGEKEYKNVDFDGRCFNELHNLIEEYHENYKEEAGVDSNE